MILRTISFLIFLAALVYPLVVQVIFPKFIVDDAYITFRYAENLALHGELNWNVGEDPIEGYTGVVLPVLLAGVIKVGIDPIVVSHGVGVFSFWLGFLALYLIARRLQLSALFAHSLLLLYATMPILFTHTFSGMETMLFVALMLVSLYAALGKKDAMLSASLLLTSLVRPEGVALSAVLFCAVGWERYRENKAAFSRFWKTSACVYLLPAIAYFVWRFAYYGHLLPNTFYAKSKEVLQTYALADIARFIRHYFTAPLFGLLLLFAAETEGAIRLFRDWLREHRFIPCALACLVFFLSLLAVLSQAILIANFSHRLYVPFLPVLWLVLALGWKLGFSSLEQTKEAKPLRYGFILSVFLALVLYQSLFQAVKIREELVFARQQIVMHEETHNLIGTELRRMLSPTETVIVYLDAGAIPYFSKLRAIDFGDLNDELLAHHTLSPEGRIDYFFSHKAGAVVITSVATERLEGREEAEQIVKDPRFQDYVLYKRFIPSDPAIVNYEFVYLRKDLYERLRKEGKLSTEA